jgi:hypothetical protein
MRIEDTPLGTAYDLLGTFVNMSESQRLHVTLWAAATRVFKDFPAFARLDFSATGPGCGKSTAIEAVTALCPEPVVVSYSTQSSVKSWLDEYPSATMGLDERDGLFGTTGRSTSSRTELIAILNAGYAANGKVMCMRSGRAVLMYVYNAMLHAGIGRTYAALADRSVTITLEKALPAETWVSVLHEPTMLAVGKDIGEWLGRREIRQAVSAQPRTADIAGDPRHKLKMGPMAAIAAVAGVYAEFVKAEEEIQSGTCTSQSRSRPELLLDALRSLAVDAGMLTSEDVRRLLPDWGFAPGRVGDIHIAGLLREAGVQSTTSNGVRGYRITENTEQKADHD